MSTLLGTASDGRTLKYDAALYEFSLGGERATFDDVQMLDARNWVRWRAPELREWFQHINASDLAACNRQARALVAMPAAETRIRANAATAAGAIPVAAGQASNHVRARATASLGAQAVAPGRTGASRVSQKAAAYAYAGEWLAYRSSNERVASVDAQGVVRIAGPGSTDLYICRENAAGKGAEVKIATIVVDGRSSAPIAQAANQPLKSLIQKSVGQSGSAQTANAPKMPLRGQAASITAGQPGAPVPYANESHALAVTYTSSIAKSYKSKSGKLSKDKQIQLESHVGPQAVFTKVSGSPKVSVTEDGCVCIPKGTKSGLYEAEVAVAAQSVQSGAMREIVTVQIEVR